MKLSLKDIGTIAENLLQQLEHEGINSLAELERSMGKVVSIQGNATDLLVMEERPSGSGTTTLTVSYIRPGVGITSRGKDQHVGRSCSYHSQSREEYSRIRRICERPL